MARELAAWLLQRVLAKLTEGEGLSRKWELCGQEP